MIIQIMFIFLGSLSSIQAMKFQTVCFRSSMQKLGAKSKGVNLTWQSTSSSMKSNTEKGHSIPAQKRIANVHGKSELTISSDVENLFLFQQSDPREKERELERNRNPRECFLIASPSRSNRSMAWKHTGMENSSKTDEEVCLKHGTKGKGIVFGSDLQGNLDQLLLDGVSTHEVHYSHSHPELNHIAKKKRKVNLDDDSLKDKQHVEPTIQSTRKMAVTHAKEDGSSFASYQSLSSTTAPDFEVNMMNNLSPTYPINYEEKIYPYLPKWRNNTDTRDSNNWKKHILNSNHGQAFSETVLGRRRNHGWKKHVNGQEKCKSLHPKCGETSGSTLNQLSYTQSDAETSTLKLDKSDRDKCCKLYPEVRGSISNGKQNGFSDNFSARVSQIESDEVFARELQEKFYHEMTGSIYMEKVDAKIAWSLQSDEVAKAAALAWQGQSNSSVSSVDNSYSPHEASSLSHFSSTPDYAATRFRNLENLERYPEMVLFEEYGNNLNDEVDLETRLELLEAVEDMHENSYDGPAYSHSYDDNDYGRLIRLDEINTFPLSVVQNENNGDACPVCLDVPSVGQTLRHLPCLHKFHQACIDTWLKRKPSCPVCKSSIA